MTLSTSILDVLSKPATPAAAGALEALARQASRNHPRLADWLRSYAADIPRGATPQYRHPGDEGARRIRPDLPTALSASDVAWLARIGAQDPATVSFDDAVGVATLAGQVDGVKNPSDRRLVDSIWAPIRVLHDRRAGEIEQTAASRPPTIPPAGLPGLLQPIIASEVPDLDPGEAFGRAQRLVDAALDKRSQVRQTRIDTAHQRLVDVALEEARRRAPVAEPRPTR